MSEDKKKKNWRRFFYPARLLLFANLTFIVSIFLLGFSRDVFNEDRKESQPALYNGQDVSLRGFICEEADVDYKSRRLVICAGGRILVTTDLYPEYDYGDYVEVSGTLVAPAPIEDFDYEAYLARYDIYSLMYYPKIGRIKGEMNGRQVLFRNLLDVKQYAKAVIDQKIPEPEAGLADAILLGYKRTVRRENLEVFSRTGLSHLIAISGSHMTILSGLLASLMFGMGCKRKTALRAVLLFLIIYPSITGLSASAVRSSIMGALSFIAIYNYRQSLSINALLLSASIMLALNPNLLRHDIGFQLSFLAVIGIIYLYPYGENWFKSFTDKYGLKYGQKRIVAVFFSALNLTLVSQIMTLPILIINFKRLSLISPLANVLVSWVFAPLLLVLIVAIIFSSFLPFLGSIFFLPAYLILRFIFLSAERLAAWPGSSIEVSGLGWGFGLTYYLFLFLFILIINRNQKTLL